VFKYENSVDFDGTFSYASMKKCHKGFEGLENNFKPLKVQTFGATK